MEQTDFYIPKLHAQTMRLQKYLMGRKYIAKKTQKTLSTIRYRTFAIGVYYEKVNYTINSK